MASASSSSSSSSSAQPPASFPDADLGLGPAVLASAAAGELDEMLRGMVNADPAIAKGRAETRSTPTLCCQCPTN